MWTHINLGALLMASFEPINPRIGQPADQNNFVLRIQMYISGDVQLHKNIML